MIATFQVNRLRIEKDMPVSPLTFQTVCVLTLFDILLTCPLHNNTMLFPNLYMFNKNTVIGRTIRKDGRNVRAKIRSIWSKTRAPADTASVPLNSIPAKSLGPAAPNAQAAPSSAWATASAAAPKPAQVSNTEEAILKKQY